MMLIGGRDKTVVKSYDWRVGMWEKFDWYLGFQAVVGLRCFELESWRDQPCVWERMLANPWGKLSKRDDTIISTVQYKLAVWYLLYNPAGLQLTTGQLASNLKWPSCLCPLSPGIAGIYHHAQLDTLFNGVISFFGSRKFLAQECEILFQTFLSDHWRIWGI